MLNPFSEFSFRVLYRWARRKRLGRKFFRVFGGLIFFILLLLGVLSSEIVQTRLAQYATDYFSERLGFVVRLEKLSLDFRGNIVLEEVFIGMSEEEKMITARQLRVDLAWRDLITQGKAHIEYISLNDGAFDLTFLPEADEFNINLFVQAIKELAGSDTTKSSQSAPFRIDRIHLQRVDFHLYDPTKTPADSGQFDPANILLRDISGEASDFLASGDTIALQTQDLSFYEPRIDLLVSELTTFYRLCRKGMDFYGLRLQIGESLLRDTLRLRFDGYAELSDFTQKVRLDINLDSSFLTTRDLSRFLPALSRYQDAFRVTGKVKGRVNALSLPDFSVKFGTDSHLRGSAYLNGLPDIERTFLKIQLDRSTFYTRDLKTWLGLRENQNFLELGQVRFRAQLVGMIGDFVADGTFDTAFGRIISDINLKLNQNTYSGQLTLQNFALGRWLGVDKMGAIGLRGQIEGRGLNQKAADFKLDAAVDSLQFNRYTYRKVTLDGRFREEAFQGEIISHDPHLDLVSDGMIDLTDSTFRLDVDTFRVDAQALNFSEKPLRLFTRLRADFTGLDPDRTVGEIGFDSLYIAYNEQADLELDTLRIAASGSPRNTRRLSLFSDILTAELEGDFTFAQLFRDLSREQKRYARYLRMPDVRPDSLAEMLSLSFPQLEDPGVRKEQYQGAFSLQVSDAEPITRSFLPELELRDSLQLKGNFRIADTLHLEAHLQTGFLQYAEQQFEDLRADVLAEKYPNRPDITGTLRVQSNKQEIAGTALQDLLLEGKLARRTLDWHTHVAHQESTDSLRWGGKVVFADTAAFRLEMASPELRLFGANWRTPDSTKIRISGKEIAFLDTFNLKSKSRFVKLAGFISEDTSKQLDLRLADIDLRLFKDYLGRDIQGRVFLDARIDRFYDTLHVYSDLTVDQLSVDGTPFGNIQATSGWNQAENAIRIDAQFEQGAHSYMDIAGSYQPARKQNALDLDLQLVGVRLTPLGVFAKGIISDLQGKAFGAVKIKGMPDAPLLNGELYVSGGGFRVDYLNTFYEFDDEIDIDENGFTLDRFQLRDANGRIAYLDNGVYHDAFSNILIDLKGEMEQFLVLNTDEDTQEAYYGQALGTGTLNMTGGLDDLSIAVNAKVGKNTRLYLPLDGYEGVEVKDYIRFVEPDTSDAAAKTPEESAAQSSTNLNIELDLEITEYAYTEIIFDKRAGDVIRGYGEGNIEFNYSSRGEFSMFGEVDIVEGAYNFTFLNVVNKRFDVKPGSRITWAGDPYDAQLDLTAEYEQYASLAPILGVQDSSLSRNNALQRQYPVEVALQLDGNLYNPDLTFDINFPEYPPLVLVDGMPLSMQGQIAAFKTRLQNDKQELNRQVFSLIVLRRLAKENTFEGVNQSAGSSVSELLTNQLSYWVSQVDERLEVDLDLQGLNSEALSGAQLRLSYSFLDGRVRITREGGFTNVQNQADISSIAGDWTLEYIITQDGRFRAKVYHKNNLSSFGAALGNTSTAGVSLLQTYSFDRLSEVFNFKRKKKIELKEPDNEVPLE